MCDYSGYDFGAHYPDSCCIDGYLWDLDSGGVDDFGNSYLDNGGYMPCPQCNAKQRVNYQAEDIENDGYESLNHPLTTKMVKNVMGKIPSNKRRMAMRYWRKGRREAIKEAKLEG
ncbi:hypothetical protein VVYB158_15350 [Vibrio vulnificus CladeA-yb158]|uniref:hypothetical protein n=1 Tax=Vibrio vulnificus TaxID=672 RepID=UPI00063DB096|nr:hypothetical protein [Vibrio vulnificus]KLI66946.1 hypothetical protein VVYB158_15350 [Vibrio vulnificus CladeA-yb158]